MNEGNIIQLNSINEYEKLSLRHAAYRGIIKCNACHGTTIELAECRRTDGSDI